jgi:hypothetical protein
VAHVVKHDSDVLAQHSDPWSHVVSQSSSTPLQMSAGGVHSSGAVHDPVQTFEPAVPQVVRQSISALAQQSYPSSQVVSQSSSTPLQISAGGTQGCHEHVPLQDRVPVVKHVVSQGSDVPAQHSESSSQKVSQSSSPPLQVSSGRTHSSHEQDSLHVRVLADPQVVAQESIARAQHSNPSSHVVSQSSS